jgi:hypothetical protein
MIGWQNIVSYGIVCGLYRSVDRHATAGLVGNDRHALSERQSARHAHGAARAVSQESQHDDATAFVARCTSFSVISIVLP